MEIGLPEGALMVLLSRGDDFLIPSGGAVFEAGDKLLVLAEKGELGAVRGLLEAAAPLAPPTG